jgi:2-polyprenyl-3-methyl-5-hydroxy-6-metoxy-1,4-benzoquinol methylase
MSDREHEQQPSTQSDAYARRLEALGTKRWKQWLDVQAPYRWNIRRLQLGFTLDVGCGIGRNLAHLGGNGVGIDHNDACVEAVRAQGFTAYLPAEFDGSADAQPARFDSLLLAHVVEHLSEEDATDLVARYLPFVKAAGRVVVITPQEAGQRTDPTHVRFVDFAATRRLLSGLGWRVASEKSFPFPRAVGRVFPYNEFVVVSERSATA